ncbi:MAG: 50S ribosomal protein L32 [Cyclobacteriaceae bacterium]
MAHPKRKISKSRRDKRRSHLSGRVATFMECSNCGASVLYHRVCTECGYYKGKPAIEKEIAV